MALDATEISQSFLKKNANSNLLHSSFLVDSYSMLIEAYSIIIEAYSMLVEVSSMRCDAY